MGALLTILLAAAGCGSDGLDDAQFQLGPQDGRLGPPGRAAPPCGTPLQSIDGVVAYSNGDRQGTADGCAGVGQHGLRFQGTELVQRYMAERFGGPGGAWGPGAIAFCDRPPPGFTVHRPFHGYSPVHGDAVVLPRILPVGHAGILDQLVGDQVELIEQNASAGGRGRYPQALVRCYIHPDLSDQLPCVGCEKPR